MSKSNCIFICVWFWTGELAHDLRFLASVVSQSFLAFGDILELYRKFLELSGGITRVSELNELLIAAQNGKIYRVLRVLTYEFLSKPFWSGIMFISRSLAWKKATSLIFIFMNLTLVTLVFNPLWNTFFKINNFRNNFKGLALQSFFYLGIWAESIDTFVGFSHLHCSPFVNMFLLQIIQTSNGIYWQCSINI